MILLPHQETFITTPAKYPAICGGYGSGKTKGAVARLIYLMGREPGINTLLGMPTYDLLRLRAMPGFEEDLTEIGIRYTLNKSEWSIEMHGFGKVYFRSYDNPGRWIAFEAAHTILDELDTLPKDKARAVWRKAVERTRQPTRRGNTIGNVSTPDHGINGFTFERWAKPESNDWHLIKASTYDNPFLPADYAESLLAQYDPTMVDAYLRGEFVSFNRDKVYHAYDRQKHDTNRRIQTGERLHVGIDFNIGGCCATVWVMDERDPVAVDEFVSKDTRDFCTKLASRYPGHLITVYPDASGKAQRTNAAQSDLQIIEQAGYRVDAPKANPAIRDRVNTVNGLLAHNKIRINAAKCPELADALETQGYDQTGAPEKFSQHPALDDWCDSAGYYLHRKFAVTRHVVYTGIGSAM
jgi:PBSX family phage terminase large subunit